jgi:hypothetical protein
MRTFPGVPISSVSIDGFGILLEQSGEFLSTEAYEELWTESKNTTVLLFNIDPTFPHIYLKEFSDYKSSDYTTSKEYISILNPFYVTTENGSFNVNDIKYLSCAFFTEDLNDGNGPFITAVYFETEIIYGVDYLNPDSLKEQEANALLTSTIVFNNNKQLVVKLDTTELQGIEVFNNDPRVTTRNAIQNFIVEDFNNVAFSGNSGQITLNEESSYIRVFNTSEKFIRYRVPSLVFSGADYVAGKSYYVGEQMYYNGDFWKCTISGIFSPNEGFCEGWQKLSIPSRFKDFLVNAVSCDFLRSEARFEEAEVLNNMAEVAVQQQIDVLLRQQGQVQRMNMAYTY